MSEIIAGKAVGEISPETYMKYVEDDFGPPTQPGLISPICSRKYGIDGSLASWEL